MKRGRSVGAPPSFRCLQLPELLREEILQFAERNLAKPPAPFTDESSDEAFPIGSDHHLVAAFLG